MGRIPVTGLLVLTLGIMLPACAQVIIQHPVGEPVSNDLGEQVEGWWVVHGEKDGELQCFLVRHLTNGAIRVATLELDSNSMKIQPQEWAGLLTHLEGAMYLNLLIEEPKPGVPPEYFLLRVNLEDGPAMLVWYAGDSVFADAVRNGELAGTVGGNTVRITASKEEIEEFLVSHEPPHILFSEEPMVFKRP